MYYKVKGGNNMKIIQFEGKEQYVCTACGSIHENEMNIDNILGYEYCTECVDDLDKLHDLEKEGIRVEIL